MGLVDEIVSGKQVCQLFFKSIFLEHGKNWNVDKRAIIFRVMHRMLFVVWNANEVCETWITRTHLEAAEDDLDQWCEEGLLGCHHGPACGMGLQFYHCYDASDVESN